jgi:hypothetical protein
VTYAFVSETESYRASIALASTPQTTFTIQLFQSTAGCGGPTTLVETRTVTTNSDGLATFTRAAPSFSNAFWATATNDATGDTSEMRCAHFNPIP